MTRTRLKQLAVVTVAAVSMLATGCSGGDEADAKSPSDSSEESGGSEAGDETDDAGAKGKGVPPTCAKLARSNDLGRIAGWADQPTVKALKSSPGLSQLHRAVSGGLNPRVDVSGVFNGDAITVFAPVDEAFAKLGKTTRKSLGTPATADTLESLLTYHVVPGRLAVDELVGSHATVHGANVEVTSGKKTAMVNGGGKVLCGGIETENATVYLIDTISVPAG